MRKLLYLLLIISLASCCKVKAESEEENKQDSSISKNLNVSILIDLSDRIDTIKHPNGTMPYFQRDIEYIKAINKGFTDHIQAKKMIQLDDQMQIFFNPEPSSPQMNNLIKQLRISFKRNDFKDSIDTIKKRYAAFSSEIYQSAIRDGNYVGSDIWGFFSNKVKDYCIKDHHRNILFILTDGYMYHDNSKFSQGTETSYLTSNLINSLGLTTSNYKSKIEKEKLGFIKANDDLKNLEVIVLGINPEKGNPFEEGVIRKYWEDWLKGMDVKSYQVKSADLPSNLEPLIQKIMILKN
ncbi:hypothetical protein [Chryseobacterium sp.]|uniref:hypothetical protein n=1 Tax=Chryseobacterium sp. TaxID=1871047 RepID=UPI0025BFA94D|nr:hypothetical protein [Chryseobacterium sp.]